MHTNGSALDLVAEDVKDFLRGGTFYLAGDLCCYRLSRHCLLCGLLSNLSSLLLLFVDDWDGSGGLAGSAVGCTIVTIASENIDRGVAARSVVNLD